MARLNFQYQTVVGPVLALAQTTEGIRSWEELTTYDPQTYKWNTERRWGKHMKGRLLSVAAGSIGLDQVNPEVHVTVGEAAWAHYGADGSVRFEQAAEPDVLESLEYAGRIIVAQGRLVRPLHSRPGTEFTFVPHVWDTADVPVHAPDRQFDPACGLTYDPSQLQSFCIADDGRATS